MPKNRGNGTGAGLTPFRRKTFLQTKSRFRPIFVWDKNCIGIPMKFSSISNSTYRRATGTRVEPDRDQNPVKICVSTDSCVRACVRACVRGMKETQLLVVKIQDFYKLHFYTRYIWNQTHHFLRWAGSLTGKPPLVSVERMYSGVETRSFMGEYKWEDCLMSTPDTLF